VVLGTMRYRFSGMEWESFVVNDEEGKVVRGRMFGGGGGVLGETLTAVVLRTETGRNDARIAES